MVMRRVPPGLPYIRVRWRTPVDDGNTFIRFNIYRRLPGSGTLGWVRIAIEEDVAVTSYRDFTPNSGQVYEYAVTQTRDVGGGVELESARTDIEQGVVWFNWAYVHEVAAPSNHCVLFSLDVTEDVRQDIAYQYGWGRQAPTAFVGEIEASELHLAGLADPYRGALWDTLRPLLTRQRTAAAVFCLRVGVSGLRYFCNLSGVSRRGRMADYVPEVTATEVAYDEAV